MGAAFLPVVFFTGLFGGIGVGLPFFIPETPNKKVLQVVCMLTGACCWLFWLTCYMAQMNPLIGPILHQHTALVMQQNWGNGQSVN